MEVMLLNDLNISDARTALKSLSKELQDDMKLYLSIAVTRIKKLIQFVAHTNAPILNAFITTMGGGIVKLDIMVQSEVWVNMNFLVHAMKASVTRQYTKVS